MAMVFVRSLSSQTSRLTSTVSRVRAEKIYNERSICGDMRTEEGGTTENSEEHQDKSCAMIWRGSISVNLEQEPESVIIGLSRLNGQRKARSL
jgi:hypothetical protein